MAGPRITRLSDPANPYGKKKTPTAAPSVAQQARNRAVSQATGARAANAALKPKATTPARNTNPLSNMQQQYRNSRQQAIENGVEGKRKK